MTTPALEFSLEDLRREVRYASLQQHDGIADAIRRGDARAAEELARLHIRSLMEGELEHRRMNARTSWGLPG